MPQSVPPQYALSKNIGQPLVIEVNDAAAISQADNIITASPHPLSGPPDSPAKKRVPSITPPADNAADFRLTVAAAPFEHQPGEQRILSRTRIVCWQCGQCERGSAGLFLTAYSAFHRETPPFVGQHDGVTPNHHIQKTADDQSSTVARMGITAGYC